jgi:hypothetical protein
MALRKIVELTGKSFVHTEIGNISKGQEAITFNAYVKVVSVSGDKNEVVASVVFSDDKNNIEKQYRFTVSTSESSKNFIAQAYQHLKTLPEFSGSTDC